MKKYLFLLVFSCSFVSAMEQADGPRAPRIIKVVLGLILSKPVPLCANDRRQALDLIKEMRAQSPAQALTYEQKLADRVMHDSIETDGKFEEDAHLIKGRMHVRRPSSPLVVECQ